MSLYDKHHYGVKVITLIEDNLQKQPTSPQRPFYVLSMAFVERFHCILKYQYRTYIISNEFIEKMH